MRFSRSRSGGNLSGKGDFMVEVFMRRNAFLDRVRSNVQSDPNLLSDPELKELLKVPKYDGRQISKLAELYHERDESCMKIRDFDYDVQRDVLQDLTERNKRNMAPSESFCLVVLFQGIAAGLLHPNELTSVTFQLLVDLLAKMISSDYNVLGNDAFGVLWHVALFDHNVQFDVNCFSSVLAYLSANRELGGEYYWMFVEFMARAIDSGNKQVTESAFSLLFNLFDDDRKLVRGQSHDKLIQIMEPFIHKFNHRALIVLARMSRVTESRAIKDTYVVLPSCFLDFVQKSSSNITIEENECEVLTYSDVGDRFDFELSNHDDFPNGLLPLDEVILDNFVPTTHLLPDDVQKVVDELNTILVNSNPNCVKKFFRTYVKLLSVLTVKGKFYDAFVAFLGIFGKNRPTEVFNLAHPFLLSSPVISPSHTIFVDGTLSPIVNSLRNSIIDLIIVNDVRRMPELINSTAQYPVLCAEMIARICGKESVPVPLFADWSTLSSLARLAIYFQHRRDSEPMRNAIFVLMFRLCVDKQTSLVCFSVNEFIECYFRFLFETNLCDMVLGVFREACRGLSEFGTRCIIEPTINYIIKIFNICTRKGYSDLVVKLSSSITLITKLTPSIVLWFSPMIKPILESLQIVATHTMLMNCLDLIFSVSQADTEFLMTDELFRLILTSIRKIGMTDAMYRLLLSCLSCSRRATKGGVFLIENPSFLPLILAACCDKCELMKLLNRLITYSSSNAGAMHDGDVDMILLDFLATGKRSATVMYLGEPIDFAFTEIQLRTLVHPLLSKICSYKSSYAVAHKFLQLALEKEPMAQMLNSVMAKVNSWPRPVFPIGPYDYVCSITGLTPSDLSSKFSISMWMNVDGPALKVINREIVIMSLDDSQQLGHFEVFMSQSELYAKFEYRNIRTSVKLLKHVPVNEWFLLTIIVQNFREGALLVTYVDKDRRMDSEMCCIMLQQGPMEIRLGGQIKGKSEVRSKDQAVVIGNFCVFSCELSDGDIHRLWAGMTCRESSLVFSTAKLCSMYQTATEVRNDITFNIKQRSRYPKPITYHMKDSRLLDNMTAGLSCAHRKLIFGLLQLSFKYSCEVQQAYMSTDQLIYTLSKPSLCIDSRIYQMVLSVYSTITEETLKYKWFISVIVNIWLWTRADAKSLLQILYIWKTCILDSNANLFQRKSLFAKLIGQFSVIFGTHDYKAQIDSENPDCLFFMKEATEDELSQVRSCFFDFIVKVGEIKLEQADVDALFCCCLQSTSSEIVLKYLRAIRSLTSGIVKLSLGSGIPQEFMNILHHFVACGDASICLESILTIHNLVGDALQQEMLYIACELQNGEKLRMIYPQLLEKIEEFPNLYPLVFLLATNLDGESMKRAANCVNVLTQVTINTNDGWYLWPTLYAFFVTDAHQAFVLDFIAQIALQKGQHEIERIFSYMILLQATLECPAMNLPCIFVCVLYGKMSTQRNDVLYALFLEIASILFFHFTSRSHSKMLVDAYNASIFRSGDAFVADENKTVRSTIKNIEDISDFFHRNFDELKFSYELQFSESDAVYKDPVCQVMFRIAEQMRDAKLDQVVEFIRYLKKRGSEGSLTSFDQTLEWIKERQSDLFHEHVKAITGTVRTLFKQVHDGQHVLQTSDLSYLLGIGKQHEARSLPKPVLDVEKGIGQLKRDDVLCRSLIPMKLKTKQRVFAKRDPNTDPIKYSANCILIMFCKAKEVTFMITQTSIVISGFASGDKIIPFRMIESLWPRENGGTNTRIELMTTNGLLLLLDFTPIANSVVMSHIQSVNEQLCHKQMSTKTDEWQDGKLSNFEYLLRLNLCSGRTFNDPALYPIFPALVADFTNCYKCKDFTISLTSITPPPMHRFGHASLGVANLKDDLTLPNFLAPEFFCFPQIVKEFDELPQWAYTGFDLVYTLRKVLESPHISALLSTWIDCVWGKYHPNPLPHKQLFLTMHMPKKMRHPLKMPSLCANITVNSKITLAYCDGHHLTACTADGHAHFARVQIDSSGIAFSNRVTMRLPKGIPFDTNASQVYTYSRGLGQFVTVTSDQSLSSQMLAVVGGQISVSATAIIFCPTPSSISIRLRDGSGECHLCHATSRICCIALSEDFHLAAYGTVAGTLHIVSTTNRREVRALTLDGDVPEAVLITRHWGFIIARTHTCVFVFTVNGELLRQAPLANRILRWTTFSNTAGFDYLAFQTADFDILACEAPRPDLATHICKCRGLVSIAYSSALESLILVTSSGKVKCAPHSVSEDLTTLPVTL